MPRPHDDGTLLKASTYFRYHLKMYAETLNWLRSNRNICIEKIIKNAMVEDHLIHARTLIEFLSETYDHARKDDVIAADYFHGTQNGYKLLNDKFLIGQAERIGGYLLHITEKPMPDLVSEIEWPIDEIANRLVIYLGDFVRMVSRNGITPDFKNDCMRFILTVSPRRTPMSDQTSS
jgi:hypothetical protein